MVLPFSKRLSPAAPLIWRCFFAAGFIGVCIQQLIYKDFMAIFIPVWPSWLPGRTICSIVMAVVFIIASICLLVNKIARSSAISLGVVLFLLVPCFHIPYHIAAYPEPFINLGDVFEGFTLSGSAFIIATTLPGYNDAISNKLYKLLPLWRIFFSVTFVVFGSLHFAYADYCASLVPAWIPGAYPWTYFAGIALIAGGRGMMFNIAGSLAANLMGE